MPITLTEFRNRFTLAEKIAIEEAAVASAMVRVYLADLASVGERGVDLDSPGTMAGVQALVAAGILAPEREAQILAAGAAPYAQAFGFHTGQQVRVLAPFAHAFPDVQSVETFTADAVQLTGGTQFAPEFLEAA